MGLCAPHRAIENGEEFALQLMNSIKQAQMITLGGIPARIETLLSAISISLRIASTLGRSRLNPPKCPSTISSSPFFVTQISNF